MFGLLVGFGFLLLLFCLVSLLRLFLLDLLGLLLFDLHLLWLLWLRLRLFRLRRSLLGLLLLVLLLLGYLLLRRRGVRGNLHQKILQDLRMVDHLGAADHKLHLCRVQSEPLDDFLSKKTESKLFARNKPLDRIASLETFGEPPSRMLVKLIQAEVSCKAKHILVDLTVTRNVLPLLASGSNVHVVQKDLESLRRGKTAHLKRHWTCLRKHLFALS
mmetsp:Transcript_46316/g.83544  ORF Transcript_46316/g.83544 Transcript_46316/m.83544 type:complete len:216 (+) Transcript_46316:185-832(+)